MRIAILWRLTVCLACPAFAQGFVERALADGDSQDRRSTSYDRRSNERIAEKDRESRERMTYIIGGAIVVAGVAIGIGVARRPKT